MNRHQRRFAESQAMREVAYTAELLQETAAALLGIAATAEPGAWAESMVSLFPPLFIELDFDGAGGILFNPSSLEHATGRAMLAELQRQAPKRVKVGAWAQEGEAR